MVALVARLSDYTNEDLFMEYSVRKNQECFDELYRRLDKHLRGVLRAISWATVNADDALQQAWLNVCQFHYRYEPGRNVKAWVTTIAITTARKMARTESAFKHSPVARTGLAEDDADELLDYVDGKCPDPSLAAERAEEFAFVRQAVESLTEPFRSTVVSVYFEGTRSKELGEQLDIPPETVRWRLHEGLRRLRSILDPQREETPTLKSLK